MVCPGTMVFKKKKKKTDRFLIDSLKYCIKWKEKKNKNLHNNLRYGKQGEMQSFKFCLQQALIKMLVTILIPKEQNQINDFVSLYEMNIKDKKKKICLDVTI